MNACGRAPGAAIQARGCRRGGGQRLAGGLGGLLQHMVVVPGAYLGLVRGIVTRSGARRVRGWDARESELVEVGSKAVAGDVSSQGTHGCCPIKVQTCSRYERPELLCRGLDFHQVFLEVDLPLVQVLHIRATPRNGGVRAFVAFCWHSATQAAEEFQSGPLSKP